MIEKGKTMAINSVCFSGNLTAEPKKFGTPENPFITFTLAVNTSRKVGGEWVDEPMYFDCIIFGNRAKALSDVLAKGMGVTVQGRMTPNNYQKENGETVYKNQINVSEIQLPKREAGNSSKSW